MTTARIEPLAPAALDGQQRALYERITAGPRAGGPIRLKEADGTLTGPFGLMLLAPEVGAALSGLGEAIRYRSSLSDRVREIAILAVAVHRRASYEWYAHERVARGVGLTDGDLDALRARDSERWTDPAERAAHRVALELAGDHGLSDATYAGAAEALQVAGLAELTALVGYYDTLSLLMSVFEVGVPEGEPDPFS